MPTKSTLLLATIGLIMISGCKGSASNPPVATKKQPQLEGTPIVSAGADGIFKDRRLAPRDFALADDLPGAIVYQLDTGSGKSDWFYVPVRSKNMALKPTKVETKLFEAIVDKKFTGGATISVFVGVDAQMGSEDKAEILIQDMYTLSGPEPQEVDRAIKKWLKDNADAKLLQAAYCRATRTSVVVQRVFKKASGSAKVSGPVFGVNGEYYAASTVYAAKRIVDYDAIPLTLPKPPSGIIEPTLPPELPSLKKVGE